MRADLAGVAVLLTREPDDNAPLAKALRRRDRKSVV